MRQRGVTVKLSPLREVVAGKRLIVVDDSIVRGTTTRQIVALLRKAGATEVHLRDQLAADPPPLLLRHRHPDRDRADRLDPFGRGDPRVRRRRLADLPLDRRRPVGARPAVRPLLLRLLRRPLPGPGPVRHGPAQVRPRGCGGRAGLAGRGRRRPRPDHAECAEPGRGAARPRPRRQVAAARGTPTGGAGVDIDAGERAVELMRGVGGGHAPAGGDRRARRLRLGDGAARRACASRCWSAPPTAWAPRPRSRWRWAGTTRSATTWWRCAPTTSSAPAPSRSSSSTTWPWAGSIPERVAAIVASIADGCRLAGCSLIGGETAEHPGLMEPDEFDLAGLLRRRRGARPAAGRDGGAGRRRPDRHRLVAGSTPTASRWSGGSSPRRDLDLGEGYAELVGRILGRRRRPSRRRRADAWARCC